MKSPTRTASSAALLALVLGACQREQAQPPSATDATPAPAAAAGEPAAQPSTSPVHPLCPAIPGTAPSGDLTATRIAAADGDGSRGLYEGPVWNGKALYFSDFTFADGFPSRIRRLTADGRLETAVEAMKQGAYDFLTKPVNLDHLDKLIARARRARDMEQ